MGAREILDRLAEEGVSVTAERGVIYLDPGDVEESLVEQIRACRLDILRLLQPADVTWRVDAMLRQVPPTGPVPVLEAKPGASAGVPGICLSCGGPVHGRSRVFGPAPICPPCVEAAHTAVAVGRCL